MHKTVLLSCSCVRPCSFSITIGSSHMQLAWVQAMLMLSDKHGCRAKAGPLTGCA